MKFGLGVGAGYGLEGGVDAGVEIGVGVEVGVGDCVLVFGRGATFDVPGTVGICKAGWV